MNRVGELPVDRSNPTRNGARINGVPVLADFLIGAHALGRG